MVQGQRYKEKKNHISYWLIAFHSSCGGDVVAIFVGKCKNCTPIVLHGAIPYTSKAIIYLGVEADVHF